MLQNVVAARNVMDEKAGFSQSSQHRSRLQRGQMTAHAGWSNVTQTSSFNGTRSSGTG